MPKYERIGNDLPDSLQPLDRSSLVVRTGSLVASILVLAAEGEAVGSESARQSRTVLQILAPPPDSRRKGRSLSRASRLPGVFRPLRD